MSDLVSGAMGPETKYDVSFTKGVLTLSLTYAGAQGSATIQLSESLAGLLLAAAAKVTNAVEQEALQGAAALISAIP